MEKIVERNMLYDFYEVSCLRRISREIYESIIFQDLSLSEVARSTASAGREFMIWVSAVTSCWKGYENKTASGRALL